VSRSIRCTTCSDAPASPRQWLDNHARRLVGDDEGRVLCDDREQVTAIVSGAVGRPGRTRAVHPETDPRAGRQAVRRLARARLPPVDENLAAFQPRRGTAARPGAAMADQPEVEPHPCGVAGDDPLLHLVVSW
jgi:hypothetical protein